MTQNVPPEPLEGSRAEETAPTRFPTRRSLREARRAQQPAEPTREHGERSITPSVNDDNVELTPASAEASDPATLPIALRSHASAGTRRRTAAPAVPSNRRERSTRPTPIAPDDEATTGSSFSRAEKPRKRSLRSTLTVALVVPGLFGTVALPAFALPDTATNANAQLTNGQSLVVSADAAESSIERDSYTATSVDDIIDARAASGYAYDSAAALAGYQGPSSQGWWRPVPGEITSPYGPRDLICNGAGCSNSFHEGIDFGNDCGTPIRAANAGRVTFVGNAGAYGNRVIIDHGDGTETIYGHIQPGSFEVQEGDVVAGGAYIANVGATGVVNGCHLDLKITVDGETTDPAAFLISRGVSI